MTRPVHHTRKGFRNPVPLDRGGVGVAVPFLLRRVAGFWRGREGAPEVVANDGTSFVAGGPTVTWIGHATVLVQMDGVAFLTDPVWSNTAFPVSFMGPRRYAPPGLALEVLPPIDFVVVSHNHYDHLDLATLRALAVRGTRFLVPLRVGALLRASGILRVDELDWWESRTIGGVTVHCVPSQHWSGRRVIDQNASLWSGWAVVGPTRRFYFGGDTGYFAGFGDIGRQLGPFGLAAVPIGAYEPIAMMRSVHLNPEEAVQAGLDLGADRMLGVHWGTFDLTDEPLGEPPIRFRAEAERRGLALERVWTPPLGATLDW